MFEKTELKEIIFENLKKKICENKKSFHFPLFRFFINFRHFFGTKKYGKLNLDVANT